MVERRSVAVFSKVDSMMGPKPSSPVARSSARHRPSRSISSLPLENLGKIACEGTSQCIKRASVSALSSPARGALTEPEKLSVASFLGHGGHHEPATAAARRRSRPASRNGHRRVGSGSNIATSPSSKTTPTWDSFNCSPRAKSAAGKSVTTGSVASTPTKKLERSVSFSRVAHQRRPSTDRQKCSSEQSTGIGSGDGDVEKSSESLAALEERRTAIRAMEKTINATDITEAVRDEEEATPQQRIPVEDPGTCAWNSAKSLPSSHPFQEPSENATETMQQEESVASTAGDEAAHGLCEISEPNNMETAPDSPVSIATLFEETNPSTAGETNPSTETLDTDDSLYVLFATETPDPKKGSVAPDCDVVSRIGSVSVEEEEQAQSSPVHKVTISCGNSSKRISVMKPALRKRRRSPSASGIAAVLLRVVSVPAESAAGHAVAVTSKRVLGPPEMISRVKSAIEDAAAQTETLTRPVHAARVVCQTEEISEDAVKSTYSKFVDIEIDLGHGCVELVQHSKAVTVQRSCVVAQDGAVDDTGWKRKQHPAAAASRERLAVGRSPRHHPHVKVNTCRIHEAKMRPRKIKTIRRGRINSCDLDSLTEFLKTTNSFSGDSWTEFLKTTKSFTPPQDDTTAFNPRPPSPPPPPPQQRSPTAPHQPPKQLPTLFISRLQAPIPASFSSYIDSSYRPGGCISSSNNNKNNNSNVISAMSILAQPQPSFSFSSSSHQDKLWEEQADIYSSGGRGTPDRRESDVDGRTPDPHEDFNLLHHQTASPGSHGSAHSHAHSQHHHRHHQHHGAVVRRTSGLSSGGGGGPMSENHGRNGHFMQQLMSRIRGSGSSPSKRAGGGCPGNNNTTNYKAREMGLQSTRRNSSAWSSCICFSVKSS